MVQKPGPSSSRPVPDLLILAHAGHWDGRFQITSLAASAAAAGRQVEIALFFHALEAWALGRWDVLDPQTPLTAGHLASLDLPPLSEMLATGRAEGRIRLFACSASVRFYNLDRALVQSRVDAVLGWQSFAERIHHAHRVVTL